MNPRQCASSLTLASLLLGGLLPLSSTGVGAEQVVPAWWTVTVDGQPMAAEVPPVIVDSDKVLVAGRSLCHSLGAEFAVTDKRISVKSGSTTLDMEEGKTEALVNGMPTSLAVAPRRQDGVMLLPVAFVAEHLGARVSMLTQARTVRIEYGRSPGQVSSSATLTAVPGGGVQMSTPPQSVAGPASPGMSSPAGRSAADARAERIRSIMLPEGLGGGTGNPGAASPSGGAQVPMQPAPLVQGGPAAPEQASVFGQVAIPGKSLTTTPYGYSAQGSNPTAAGGSTGLPGDLTTGTGAMGLPSTLPTLPQNRSAEYGLNEAMAGQTVALAQPFAVIKRGSMDPLEALVARPSADGMGRPDPAITGLVIERHGESLFSTFGITYRVTNLGTVPVARPVLVRLKIGSNMGDSMQIVQDNLVDRLAPGESHEFFWEGSAQKFPCLNGAVILAESEVMVNQGEYDAKQGNNIRKVRMAY